MIFNILTAETAADVAEQVAKDLDKIKPASIANILESAAPMIMHFSYQVLIILIIFFAGGKLIRFICKAADKSLAKLDIDLGIKKFLLSLISVACYALMIFIIADRVGISSASIVAVLGSAGIAVGLALQGSLSNFAGGMLILFMKPFVIGDYIVTSSVEGTVHMIGLIYTTLITIDNKTLTIPNGSLANGVITNVTANDTRRVDITVGVSYSSDLKKAKEIVERVYTENEKVMKDSEISVYIDSLGASSVLIGARGWCKTEDYWTVRWSVLENIKNEFDSAGIEIPYNQIDVNIKDASRNLTVR